MKESLQRRSYLAAVLASYLELPDTPSRSRPPDRALAARLYHRNIPIETVEQAFLLAATRRRFRPPETPPLQPIRSLHYFLPVVEELLRTPLPKGYELYLKRKLAPVSARNAQKPSITPPRDGRKKRVW